MNCRKTTNTISTPTPTGDHHPALEPETGRLLAHILRDNRPPLSEELRAATTAALTPS